jgi:uncharacterized protein (TIGR02118 family)
MIKVMLLLHRRPDLTQEQFRSSWHGPHQALLVQLPGLRRLVLNDVLPGLDGSPATCDGVAEDWFDSLADMQAAFGSTEGQAVAADAASFIDLSRLRMLVVEEHEVLLTPAQSRSNAGAGADLACQELVELVTEYLEDRLPLPERRRFDTHLAMCSACQRYLEQMRTTLRVLGRLPDDSVSPEARDRLLVLYRAWKRQAPQA